MANQIEWMPARQMEACVNIDTILTTDPSVVANADPGRSGK